QIERDIKNYLYAVNFDEGETVKCEYTNDIIDIGDDFFKNIEALFLGTTSTLKERKSFRQDIQTEYITQTLAQEINIRGKKIEQTKLFEKLLNKYNKNLKENALALYNDNDNFRRAILDYNSQDFKKYDHRLKSDVNRMINNLVKNFQYTEEGALQVCLYVLDNELVKKY
ncbi:MAG: serine protein kinase, partial [Marinilabiliales bacterium]